VYGFMQQGLSTGLTISTYVLGLISGTTFGVGVSEYFGLKRLDNVTYAFNIIYDPEDGDSESEDDVVEEVGKSKST